MKDEEEGALLYEAVEDSQNVYGPAGDEPNDKHEAKPAKWQGKRSGRRIPGLGYIASALLGCLLTSAAFSGHQFYKSASTAQTDALATTTNSSSPVWTASGLVAEPDWTRFAYSSYSTDGERLCHSVMMVERLVTVGAKGQRVIMYPKEFHPPERATRGSRHLNQLTRSLTQEQRLLVKARDEYGATLVPVEVLRGSPEQEATWMDSFTKLLVFNLTQYDRVVHMDSDSVVLKSMDELFFLPPASVAMPRAYWLLPQATLSNQIMVVTPSANQFERNLEVIQHHDSSVFDMDIVNGLYKDDCAVIPHRPYNLLTGEFRFKANEHRNYLGTAALPSEKVLTVKPLAPSKGSDEVQASEVNFMRYAAIKKLVRRARALFVRIATDSGPHWDAQAVYDEAKFVHFSDWPYPKPWIRASQPQTEGVWPACEEDLSDGTCAARKLWLHLYDDFRSRRSRVCGLN